MSAFDSVTGQRDAQDFRSAGLPDPQDAQRTFGCATHARQTFAIAGTAFGMIAKSAAGLVALAVAMLVVVLAPALIAVRGVPLLPEPRSCSPS